jgi:cyclase
MLTKRIIPCLDVAHGKTVKGTRFLALKDMGDPVALAQTYAKSGADELVFLDISASHEQRQTQHRWVKEVAENIFIPFTVGGGIRSLEDAEALLALGADKVSINTAALDHPSLITEIAKTFGSQAVVVAIDTQPNAQGGYEVFGQGGRKKYPISAETWIQEVQERGAGEILLTSIHLDGTQAGFDLDFMRHIRPKVRIPIIASGGAGKKEDFVPILSENMADAALAAGIFHRGQVSLIEVKNYLATHHIPIRL